MTRNADIFIWAWSLNINNRKTVLKMKKEKKNPLMFIQIGYIRNIIILCNSGIQKASLNGGQFKYEYLNTKSSGLAPSEFLLLSYSNLVRLNYLKDIIINIRSWLGKKYAKIFIYFILYILYQTGLYWPSAAPGGGEIFMLIFSQLIP